MSTKFCQLTNLPPLPETCIAEALADGFEFTASPFTCAKTATMFQDTAFYKLLSDTFNAEHISAKYLKNPPNSFYEWHIDKVRNCSLNWIIKSNSGAKTFYRSNNHNRFFWDIEEIKYNADCPTLLDTTHEHCIFNNYPEERIILSVSIRNNHSYADILTFLKALTISKY